MKKTSLFLLAVALAASTVGSAQAQAPTVKLTHRVKHFDGRRAVAHIVSIPASGVALRLVKAPAGKRETVSTLCRRVSCLAGINGGRFTLKTGKLSIPVSEQVLTLSDPKLQTPSRLFGGRSLFGEVTNSVYADSRRKLEPRTLLGQYRNGSWFMAVIDGRQPGHSQGVTADEAAIWMRQLGAVRLTQYDEGSSSTLVVSSRVVNRVSSGQERPVASGIFVVSAPKAQATTSVPKKVAPKPTATFSIRQTSLRLAPASIPAKPKSWSLPLVATMVWLLTVRLLYGYWRNRWPPRRTKPRAPRKRGSSFCYNTVMKFKKIIYITLFTLLGFMLATITHAVIEIPALNIFIIDPPSPRLTLTYSQWKNLHDFWSMVLWILGLLFGFKQGAYWWHRLYERKATTAAKRPSSRRARRSR